MRRVETLPADAPAEVNVKMLARVMHGEPGCPPRELVAGATVPLPRELALRWLCRGLVELADAYQPSGEELRAAARLALDDLAEEQSASGMTPARWEAVPWHRSRLLKLSQILAADAPQEVA